MIQQLAFDEEQKLIAAAQRGDETARHELILRNMGLCAIVADQSPRPNWMDREDLIDEGVLGLSVAIDKFDLSKGHKFTTYAAQWIKQAINRCLERNYHPLYTPSYAFWQIGQLGKCRQNLSERLGREPSVEELANETGIGVDQIQLLETVALTPKSLDEPTGTATEEFCDRLADRIPDHHRFETAVDDRLWLDQALSLLPEEMRELVSLRFGLDGQPALTIKEIAGIKGVSKQAIRRRETLALRVLRKKLDGVLV